LVGAVPATACVYNTRIGNKLKSFIWKQMHNNLVLQLLTE
jgi:hypothetical protein